MKDHFHSLSWGSVTFFVLPTLAGIHRVTLLQWYIQFISRNLILIAFLTCPEIHVLCSWKRLTTTFSCPWYISHPELHLVPAPWSWPKSVPKSYGLIENISFFLIPTTYLSSKISMCWLVTHNIMKFIPATVECLGFTKSFRCWYNLILWTDEVPKRFLTRINSCYAVKNLSRSAAPVPLIQFRDNGIMLYHDKVIAPKIISWPWGAFAWF